MRQLDPAHVQALFNAQQPAIDQGRQGIGRGAYVIEAVEQPLLGDVLPKPRTGQQVVFDHLTHRRLLIGKRALVIIAENAGMRTGEQVEGNFLAPLGDPRIVELSTNQAEQRWLDLGMGQFRSTGDEAYDGGRHLIRDESFAGLKDRCQCLFPVHRCQPQPILRDARHRLLQALERCQVIFPQRNEHSVIAAREIEPLSTRIVFVELRLDGFGWPVLDQIGQFLDETRRACTAELVALRQREDFLELIENQQRDQSRARLIPQHIVAMVQEFP